MIIDGIDYIGISDKLPIGIKYFKEELTSTILKKNLDTTEIRTIISVAVECNVNSLKVINTPVRVSNEGQRLSGKKLLVEISLNYKIKYLSNTKKQYVYILKSSANKVFYIVAPNNINGQRLEDLVRRRKISTSTYIEDIYAQIKDSRSIYIRLLLLIDLHFKE